MDTVSGRRRYDARMRDTRRPNAFAPVLPRLATASRGRARPRTPARGRAPVAAIILIVLGTLFLLGNLGLIPRLGPLFAQWWPLILIIVGASLLWRR